MTLVKGGQSLHMAENGLHIYTGIYLVYTCTGESTGRFKNEDIFNFCMFAYQFSRYKFARDERAHI